MKKNFPQKPDFRKMLREGFWVLAKGSEKKKLNYSKYDIKKKLLQVIVISTILHILQI